MLSSKNKTWFKYFSKLSPTDDIFAKTKCRILYIENLINSKQNFGFHTFKEKNENKFNVVCIFWNIR